MPEVRYPCVRELLKPMLDALARAAHARKADIDARYARLGVSTATVRAWKNGYARPRDPAIVTALVHDAVTALGKDRTWCEALLACLDAPPGLRAEVLREVPGASESADAAPGHPADRAPFLTPPMSPNRLVGRDRELRDVARRLSTGSALSITALRGLPGVGKTTLAVALAHETDVRRQFPDGVLWVGLGRQPDVDDGLRRWAAALGLDPTRFEQLSSRTARAQAVHDRIGLRRMLLVIDDAWAPADALAFRIGGPNCAHLLTTRSPAIAHDFAAGSVLFVRELMPGEGVRLILSLAPDLPVEDRGLVRELVSRVGALPMALNLAGRQVWKLGHAGEPQPVRALLDSLGHAHARMALAQPFAPLDPPALQADAEGQVSLSAVIRVSYQALDEAGQRAFAALAVLPAKPETFSREAAMAAAGCDEATIQQVCDAGMLDAAGDDGRLTLHQTLSDFAATQLTDSAAAARRFAEWGFRVARDHTHDVGLIEREMPVLRGAMAHARAQRLPEFALTVNYLYRYIAARGQHAAAEPLFGDALALSREIGHDLGLAWSAMNVGNIVWRVRNDHAGAEAMMREAAEVFRRVGDDEKLSDALAAQGEYLGLLGRHAEAEAAVREAIAIGYRIGDLSLVAQGNTNLGVLSWQRGDNDGAIAFYRQGLEAARACGYGSGEATILENLGRRLMDKGLFDEARAMFLAGYELAKGLGNVARTCGLLMWLGELNTRTGMLESAEDAYREAVRLSERHRAESQEHRARARLGRLLRDRGRLREAGDQLARAAEIAERLGYFEALAEYRAELALAQTPSPAN